MKKIYISFYSYLEDYIGKKKITLDLVESATLADFLKKLKNSLGKKPSKIIFTTDYLLNKYILLGINGIEIKIPDNLDKILEDEDEISIVPAIAGG